MKFGKQEGLGNSAVQRLARWTCEWVVRLSAAAANTGWMTVFGRASHLGISPTHPGQLSLLLSAGREVSTSGGLA